MKDVILYIHGKDGSAAESEHYRALFPDCEVIGFDYHGNTPWAAGKEILNAVKNLKTGYENITLVANSIGAYFSMNAGIDRLINHAYFISPIVDMEKLIKLTLLDAARKRLRSEGCGLFGGKSKKLRLTAD